MKSIFAILPFFFALSSFAQVHPVEQLDKQLNAYIINHDKKSAEGLYHDLFVLQASGGIKKYKKDMVSDIENKALTLEINETSDVKIIEEGKTVVLTGILRQKGTWNDKAFDYTLMVTDTWVKTKKGWKLLAGHASKK
jgi:hypothetical protein